MVSGKCIWHKFTFPTSWQEWFWTIRMMKSRLQVRKAHHLELPTRQTMQTHQITEVPGSLLYYGRRLSPLRVNNNNSNNKSNVAHSLTEGRLSTSTILASWNGPARVAFTDGHYIGVTFDRNGLRRIPKLETSMRESWRTVKIFRPERDGTLCLLEFVRSVAWSWCV
jgi:Glutamine amidotransferases class-II